MKKALTDACTGHENTDGNYGYEYRRGGDSHT